MNKKLLISLLVLTIVLEIFIIFNLSIKLLRKTGFYLLIYEPLNKSQIIFYNESQTELKYFYEPIGTEKRYFSNLFNRSVVVPINNDSLYERYNYSVNKPENTYRIVSLGDSFTEGLWVNISNSYSEVLEDLLNNYSKNCNIYKRFEVINLGVGGYDIAYSNLRFKKRGIKYQPDLVIWFLKHDDFRIINELWINFTLGVSFPDFQTRTEEMYKMWSEKTNEYLRLYDDRKDENIRKNYIIKPLIDFFETTKENKIRVVIFTHFSRIGDDYDDLIENITKRYEHVYFLKLNIDPTIYNERLVIYNNPPVVDFHPNEEGHRVIALRLFSFIVENFLKKC